MADGHPQRAPPNAPLAVACGCAGLSATRATSRYLFNEGLLCGYYPHVGKWVRIDRRYSNPYRLTRYAKRVITAWAVAGIATFVLVGETHGWFAIPAAVAVVGYAG